MCAQLQPCSTKAVIGTTIVDDCTDITHQSVILYANLEIMTVVEAGSTILTWRLCDSLFVGKFSLITASVRLNLGVDEVARWSWNFSVD